MKSPDITDLEKINKQLFAFIWNFKHGDNIHYNFEILAALYESMKTAKKVSVDHPVYGERLVLKRKSYNFGELIGIMKTYEMFGAEEDKIYSELRRLAE